MDRWCLIWSYWGLGQLLVLPGQMAFNLIFPGNQISCLSYLDRWRLLWFSCGPGQLLVLPGQMALTLILLWTRSAVFPTWTDGVYYDPPVDQVSCLSYLDRWRLLWSSYGPIQRLALDGPMAFTLILLWTRSAACPTWTDGVYSDSPVDQVRLLVLPGQMAFTLIPLWTGSDCLSYLDRWRLLWFSCGPGQIACPTWTDGIYSDSPVDQVRLLVLPGQKAFTLILLWTRSDCLSYLDRWRLLSFSCGPGQTACPTWTDGIYSDPPVDRLNDLP